MFDASASKLIAVLKKHRRLLILVKGSPDPDAIASSFALQALATHLGIESDLITQRPLSLPQNRAFVKMLDIPLKVVKSLGNLSGYDGYTVTDHQSGSARELDDRLPCVVHIDHHEPVKETRAPEFALMMAEAGSASTIVTLLLMHTGISLDPHIMTRVSTALLFGIENDTDRYTHAAKVDYDAIDFLSRYSDNRLLRKISSIPVSKKTLALFRDAMASHLLYHDWLIAGLGYVDADNRDSIAVTADLLLKQGTSSTVVVFAIIENEERHSLTLDASFRSSIENLELNDIIKEITAEGGGRRFKGAYQVPLDYFSHCPDRTLLWKTVELTTIEALKKRRDGIPITELKSLYRRFRKRLSGLLDPDTPR